MERPYEFFKKLYEVHLPDRVNPEKMESLSGVKVTSEWKIATSGQEGIVLKNAVMDLQEYFAVSMWQELDVVISEKPAAKTIYIGVDPQLPERSFRIEAGEGITVYGVDEKYAAQGCYHLEDEMNMNEAPVVEPGCRTKTMRFSPRLQYSGFPGDFYPDEHLRMIAHAGMDTIGVNTRNFMKDPALVAKINDIIARAANFGLQVYTFSGFKNEMHPDEPGAFAYYDAMYGKLFELCPGLKGFIVVGEACEFPSRDPRTTGKTWRESKGGGLPSPGWFPCSDYPQFISMLKAVIDKHAKGVEFIFWTYNWGYQDVELRQAMLRTLPQDITIMATFEMFAEVEVAPGVKEYTTDYTLWQIGPSQYFESEAIIAKERNMRMMSMTGTSGNTWDIGLTYYLPTPQRWIERWKAVTDAQDHLRLDGIREAHTWGMWQNFLTEMEKYAFMTPSVDMDALLRKIVERDFGAENTDEMLEVFQLFSDGIGHCVSTNEDQYGPARVGPSYPLFFQQSEDFILGPESKQLASRETCANYPFNLDYEARLLYETEEYLQMMNLFDEGVKRMNLVVSNMTGRKGEEAERMLGVAKFIANTARTVYHVKRWHYLKGKLGIYVDGKPNWAGGRLDIADAKKPVKPLVPVKNARPVVLELIEILRAEKANAEATIPLVEADSRLGYNKEIDYSCAVNQLQWKIAWAEKTLQEELLPLL